MQFRRENFHVCRTESTDTHHPPFSTLFHTASLHTTNKQPTKCRKKWGKNYKVIMIFQNNIPPKKKAKRTEKKNSIRRCTTGSPLTANHRPSFHCVPFHNDDEARRKRNENSQIDKKQYYKCFPVSFNFFSHTFSPFFIELYTRAWVHLFPTLNAMCRTRSV